MVLRTVGRGAEKHKEKLDLEAPKNWTDGDLGQEKSEERYGERKWIRSKEVGSNEAPKNKLH